jgi:hypothetical protein
MLAQHGCGLVCEGDFIKMVLNVRNLMADNVLYERISRQSINYVRAYHDKDKVIQDYEQALLSVWNC